MIPCRNEVAAPVMNAYVERFMQPLQKECLNNFLVFGTRDLDYRAGEFLAFYHEDRPHQGKGNVPLQKLPRAPATDVVPLRDVRCRQRLGGLLKSYSRKAA